MRRVVVFLGISLVASSVVMTTDVTRAGQPTSVTHNCYDTKVRPKSILFACGDGNYYVDHLRWKGWHKRLATGRGIFHFNDCDPNCAEGEFHKRRGKLILRRRLWCPDANEYVFRRAKVVYRKAWNGSRRNSLGLYCPF